MKKNAFLILFILCVTSCHKENNDNHVISKAPIADFSFNQDTIGLGGIIEFADISKNNVNSREWIFEGGTPGTSNEKNPRIQYLNSGEFSVVLTVSNEYGTNIKAIDSCIIVTPPFSGWIKTNIPENCGNCKILEISDDTLYVDTENLNCLISENGGESWSTFTDNIVIRNALALKHLGNKYIVAGSLGIYTSINEGMNWDVKFEHDEPLLPAFNYGSIAVKSSTIYIVLGNSQGYLGYLLKSEDMGESWEKVLGFSGKIWQIYNFNGILFLSTSLKIYKSTDGVVWESAVNGIDNPYDIALTQISNKLFAFTSGDIYISSDDGISWEKVSNCPWGCFPASLNEWLICVSAGVFASANEGVNWIDITEGITNGDLISALICNQQRIYISTTSIGGNHGAVYFKQSLY